MSVPISTSITSSTSYTQARNTTASDNINYVADPLLNECCQFNNRNVCKVCAKVFTQKYSLNRHMRTHTGEKLYPCTECNKAFSQKHHVIQHMRTHTGVKPFKCTKCDKAFSQNGHLTEHMRAHTGEKPFKCTKCDKAFTLKGNLKTHTRRVHEVAEVLKINLSNCNNTRDEMINNYYKEMQDICNSRKIKYYVTSMRQMLMAVQQLLAKETFNSFFEKTILFLKYMTSPNSTTILTHMLLNNEVNFSNNFNVILDMTDEQLKEIASYKHIQDISSIYQQHGMITYEKFKLYDNFLYQSNETESNIKIKSHASAIILNKLMISSESLNKLSAFFAFPIFKDDKNNYKVELVDNICKMLTIKTIPSEDELTTFLNNSHIKNNKGLFVAICNMCNNNKGIPDKNQLNMFLDNRRFKNQDGTLNCSLIQKICNMCNTKGIPDENKLNIFLDNLRFKNTDGTLNSSLIIKICSMCYRKGIPDEKKLNIFLDNPKFKNEDGTLNYSLIAQICTICRRKGIPDENKLNIFLDNPRFKNTDGTLKYSLIDNICSMCYMRGIPNDIELNAFLENYNFKINGTINYDLIAPICSICYKLGMPSVKELNDFLTTIFACSYRTLEDNLFLIKLLVALTYAKGIPKKTLITDFISWLTEQKQINLEDYKLMRHLLYNESSASRFIPTKEELAKTEKKIKGILKDKNIEIDTEFGLDNFNIKILSLYQILKSDIGNTITEFIKFYPKNADLYLDDFIKILFAYNLDNLNKVLDLIKTPEFADKFNSLDYKNKIIQLLQIKNISYSLIKEAITELPVEDIVDYVLIALTSASKKINRQEFAYLRQCRNILLQQNFPQIVVNIYFKIITRFNQDDIEKYSKTENFQIITNNMSIKFLYLLTKNVSISEIRQIFNEKINYKNSNITEQTSTTMFNTALMFNKRMEATAEYNHEKFELLSATENTTLIQLKNNNGEINNNIVLHDFLACIANNLNIEVDYTYDNKNKTLVIENVFKKKSFIAPQLKITKTGVIITNWSLAQTNEFFNFVNAKDENDAIKNRLYQEEIALAKRKRSATGELSPKRQRTDNQAEISLDVIINMMQKEMFITDSLWKTIYDYRDKLNNNCIQQLANKYKNYLSEDCNSNLPADSNDYFIKTMEFIKEKIDDNKLNMELEAIKSGIIDNWLLDQELSNSIEKLNQKERKDRTFFQQISAESLELKQTNARATKRKLFADKIINYLKAQNSIVFNSTEMQLLDILKEYKDFVSVEIITNYIIDRILICNTDSTNEWQQIIKEKSVIEDSHYTFENPFVDEEDGETLDELLS